MLDRSRAQRAGRHIHRARADHESFGRLQVGRVFRLVRPHAFFGGLDGWEFAQKVFDSEDPEQLRVVLPGGHPQHREGLIGLITGNQAGELVRKPVIGVKDDIRFLQSLLLIFPQRRTPRLLPRTFPHPHRPCMTRYSSGPNSVFDFSLCEIVLNKAPAPS